MPQYSFNELTGSGVDPNNPALDGISFQTSLQADGKHQAIGYDGSNFYAYLWDPDNDNITNPENPPFVIIPNDITGNNGAWILLSLSSGLPAHASTHEDGAGDEINVNGLSGVLADQQPAAPHAATHTSGADDIQNATNSQKGLATAGQITALEGLLTENSKIFYVGKHGNDSNSGKILSSAFLTFGAAITAAAGETPSASNLFTIVCLDAGIYLENITCQQYVSIYAPNAEINGNLVLADDMSCKIKELSGIGSGIGIEKPAGQTSTTYCEVDKIDVTSAAIGCANLATGGVLILDAKQVYIDSGVGVGSSSSSLGHMHIKIGGIYIRGNNGIGLARTGTGTMVGRVDHILESGSPATTTGILVVAGIIDLNISTLSSDTAYNIALGATFNAFINELSGLTVNAGTENVTLAGAVDTGWFGFDEITIMPTDFRTLDDDDSEEISADGAYVVGSGKVPDESIVSKKIPKGYKATAVMIYGSSNFSYEVFENERDDGTTATLKSSSAVANTEEDITDVASTDSNYLSIVCDAGSNERWGGYIKIEKV